MNILKNKKIIIPLLILIVLGLSLAVYQVIYLKKAHSTFDNYYAFRGCTQLVEKTDTYGTCKLSNGKEIKIVLYQGKWYLDGDLPCGFMCF